MSTQPIFSINFETLKGLILSEYGYQSDNVATVEAYNKDRKIHARGEYKFIDPEMAEFAMSIYLKSAEYVPVDTGALKRSIYIKAYKNSEGQDAYEIGYKKNYARFVHEIGFYHHEWPTRYKFLEDAAYEVLAEYGYSYTVSIEYYPLRIFVNDWTKGTNLYKVSKELAKNASKEWQSFVLGLLESHRVGDTYEGLKPEEAEYGEVFNDFIDWWVGKRGLSAEQAVQGWFERTRHRIPRNWLNSEEAIKFEYNNQEG